MSNAATIRPRVYTIVSPALTALRERGIVKKGQEQQAYARLKEVYLAHLHIVNSPSDLLLLVERSMARRKAVPTAEFPAISGPVDAAKVEARLRVVLANQLVGGPSHATV